MRVCALIMAGGKGERFWPFSRVDRPKQFLTVVGDRSLLQQTVDRAGRLVGVENVYIVTGSEYIDLAIAQLPSIPVGNIIREPVGRDTAPCIGLACLYAKRKGTDTVMVVLPADHLILNEEQFLEVMRTGISTAWQEQCLVTIGIRPTRPETGYGYIRYGASIPGNGVVRRVMQFTEKPDHKRALEFLQNGDFLWNSGIFCWRLDVIRHAMEIHLPEMMVGLRQIDEAIDSEQEGEIIDEIFPQLSSISVDYGILEREKQVLVVPGDFGWDDLGSWTALERVDETDANGNLVNGAAVLVDTENSIIRTSRPDKLVATLGLKGVVVVDTEDVLLVAEKNRVADLKKVVAELRDRGLQKYLHVRQRLLVGSNHEVQAAVGEKEAVLSSIVSTLVAAGRGIKIVDKPWGREIWWSVTDDYVGKIIEVEAGHSLSLQYHLKKRETMMFIKGQGEIEVRDETLAIESGLIVDILPGVVHRVVSVSKVVFLEVSTPEIDDVVRLQDNYGRTGSFGND